MTLLEDIAQAQMQIGEQPKETFWEKVADFLFNHRSLSPFSEVSVWDVDTMPDAGWLDAQNYYMKPMQGQKHPLQNLYLAF